MDDNINQGFQNQFESAQNNGYQPAAAPSYSLNVDPGMLRNLTGWATFRAIIEIIYGALTCLGIITAVYGVPIIISGVKLLNAVDHLKRYIAVNDNERISEAFNGLNSYFKVRGIATILTIVMSIILFIAYIAFFIFIFSQMNDFMYDYNYNY